MKAVRSLPEDEREVVLAQLVERALGDPAGALPASQPDPPSTADARPQSPTPSVPTGVAQALGTVASEKLVGNGGVAEVAALCGVGEQEVRDALREVTLEGRGPRRLLDYLRLLADGLLSAQARRKLKLTRAELEALHRDPAATRLSLRLGRLLLAKTEQRDTLRALRKHNPIMFGPPRSAPPLPTIGTHDLVRQLLLAGQDVERVARTCDIRVDAARTALREVADHPDAGEPLASILRLIADGHSCAEAARELGISQQELSAALDPLRSSPLQHKVTHAFTGSAAARPLVGTPGAEMVSAGALGSGAQQMVPVRFPEAQHQRLKDWCSTHGFSMAVVVRGLVERFLDEQDRRAA